MLMIRLQRVGRKHDPAFRLVVVDRRRSTKSGRFIEILGSYHPRRKTVSVKPERIKRWLALGAKASGTVHNLLVDQKVIEGKKVNMLPKRKPKVEPELAKTEIKSA
ncbi:MAG: 30S ribosomal protein S16 [Candidatus Vogelbacteria bacterium]|nr:30S ribosomal protein S16 [Candidatus Vogelbacteria bacterium]